MLYLHVRKTYFNPKRQGGSLLTSSFTTPRCRCGGNLVDFDFLANGAGRLYSGAKLVGFNNPHGKKCTERDCGATYGYNAHGWLKPVYAPPKSVKYIPDPRVLSRIRRGLWEKIRKHIPNRLVTLSTLARNGSLGEIYEIVEEWQMLDF
jgi:hypothetical protein